MIPRLVVPVILLAASAAAGAQTGLAYRVVDRIMVRIQQPYPDGYAPAWKIRDGINQVPATSVSWRSRSTDPVPSQIRIQLAEVDGRPVLAYDGYCLMFLEAPARPIDTKPMILRAVEFRRLGDPSRDCAKMSRLQHSYAAAIRLSADADGNLTMDVNIDQFAQDGSRSYTHRVEGYRIPNQMTPLAALQDLDRKAIAARKAEQDRLAALQALRDLRDRARAGDLDSMVRLGDVLAGSKDPALAKEGLDWWAKAANKGSDAAAFSLAEAAEAAGDHAAQLRWYTLAANRGDRVAMYNIGIMAKQGTGMPASLSTARRWMLQSAEKGYDPAIRWLKANDID